MSTETIGFIQFLNQGFWAEDDNQFWTLERIQWMLTENIHQGSCTKEACQCSLCLLKQMLEDYERYCIEAGLIINKYITQQTENQ